MLRSIISLMVFYTVRFLFQFFLFKEGYKLDELDSFVFIKL